ncbi:MAG TPA: hypothetical protein VKP65_26100 [Rhodothermales bacterium]|nr:hypothetical protein [Rhodothermales bacterium]
MPEGINPWKYYPTREAARYLGLETSSLSKILEFELPCHKVGPSHGSIYYFGITILCYLVGLPPVDVRALVEPIREDLIREAERPTKVQPPPGHGKTWVL